MSSRSDEISPTKETTESHAVEKVERTEAPITPGEDFVAWLQCAAGFCIFCNTWGLLNSFGAFQAYYKRDLLPSSSASDISWIGTIQSSFIMLGSVYSGPLYDWGYVRALILIGSFMIVFGTFMTSLCTEYWQFVLAQGLFMGIGLGCLFTPAVGVVASHFSKSRGLAMGIASSGSTIGGIIYPIVFYKLVGPLKFGWTVRIIAFIMLALSVLPVGAMRARVRPPAIRRIFDRAAWGDAEYTLFAIALFVGYIGMYVPYFYIQLYCVEQGIITGDLNFYLLPIINASGFFGRIFFGGLADKIGPMNAFATASGACAILLFGWMGIHDEASILIFCILYGFFSAGIITLPATVIAISLCPDIRQFGVRLTMQLIPSAIGLLIGSPIAGAIQDKGWLGLQGFSAATVSLCTILTLAARIAKVGWAFRGKC